MTRKHQNLLLITRKPNHDRKIQPSPHSNTLVSQNVNHKLLRTYPSIIPPPSKRTLSSVAFLFFQLRTSAEYFNPVIPLASTLSTLKMSFMKSCLHAVFLPKRSLGDTCRVLWSETRWGAGKGSVGGGIPPYPQEKGIQPESAKGGEMAQKSLIYM